MPKPGPNSKWNCCTTCANVIKLSEICESWSVMDFAEKSMYKCTGSQAGQTINSLMIEAVFHITASAPLIWLMPIMVYIYFKVVLGCNLM